MKELLNHWYHPEMKTAGSSKGQRDYYLDNLKFVLIVFVVLCHFALKLSYIAKVKYILEFIYLFHMPCFVFINGYLAKRIFTGGKLRVNKIFSIFLMYLIFKFTNMALGYLFHENAKLSLFKDASAPWYLIALCIWLLSVPVLERIKTKFLISGSFLLGLFAGYINSIGDIFSLSRVFVFLPFFVLGYCLSEEKLYGFLNKRLRIQATIFLAAVLICIVVLQEQINPVKNIIYGASPYKASLGKFSSYGFIIRGCWYVIVVSVSSSVMLLVPRCKMFFTQLGERTLQVYMTHIWIRNILVYTGFFITIKSGPKYLAILVLAGSIVLTFLLANRLFKKIFDTLTTPNLFKNIMKPD